MACVLTVLGAGCQGYTTDFSTPVAVAIVTTRVPPLRLEEDDTLRVGVLVLDRAGDSVPGAHARMISLDPDTVAVDSTSFAITAVHPGTGRVIALAGNLQSAPLTITVLRAPDSLGATSPVVDTVPAADSTITLSARLFDLHSDSVPQGLNWGSIGDTVFFAIVYPPFDSLAVATVRLGNDSLAAAVVTGATGPGTASVVVRRKGPPSQPDSVVVQATAHRAKGPALRGSPVQFVVRFQ